MKSCGKSLALCVCHAWVTNAFLILAPKTESLRVVLHSSSDIEYWNRDAQFGGSIPPLPVQEGLQDRNSVPLQRTNNIIQHPTQRTDKLTLKSVPDQQRHVGDNQLETSTQAPKTIQGNSRKTFSHTHTHSHAERAHVSIQTDGRPLNAEFELWDGPDNTPTKMKVYSEDGRLRPFNALVETPSRGGSNSMSIRNVGPLEFPVAASAVAAGAGAINPQTRNISANSQRVQGGALETWRLDYSVGSVQISLQTDGLPLMATVELWGAGGHIKQIAEIYNDDGRSRSFFATVETPGADNSIAIRNTGPLAYPLSASVEPCTIEKPNYDESPYNSVWPF